MENAELVKALRCKEYFDLCKDASCKYHVNSMRSGCHCKSKVKEYTAADALEMADAKLHEQDLRIADLVAHLNAEQEKVAELTEANQDCGASLPESLAKLNPSGYWLKTPITCEPRVLDEFSKIWPTSGKYLVL